MNLAPLLMGSWRSPCGRMEIRHGDWQIVLDDVEACDAVLADPPYGKRTHDGHNRAKSRDGGYRATIDYNHWTADDVATFVSHWSPRTRGWFCGMTSDDLIPAWRDECVRAGRYDFAPVPILAHRVRRAGDGPASSAVYLMVSRPMTSEFSRWRALPGFYLAQLARSGPTGAKDLGTMRALVRDYTKPGDLIVDPCAGGGTTLLAAAIEGRFAIGAEFSAPTYQDAVKRLSAGYTPATPIERKPKPKQGSLLGG